MMAKRKAKRRRKKPAFSILNALEAFTYASIVSEGTTGGSVYAFITGKTDLGYSKSTTVIDVGLGTSSTTGVQLVGTGQISLGDLMTEPSLALTTIAQNFQQNLIPMSLAAFSTSIGFRIGRRLLRKPISSINVHLIKPALGAGIRL